MSAFDTRNVKQIKDPPKSLSDEHILDFGFRLSLFCKMILSEPMIRYSFLLVYLKLIISQLLFDVWQAIR